MPKEIRRHTRKPHGGRVEISWADASGAPWSMVGVCKDVSETGMRVTVRDAPPLRAYMQLRAPELKLTGTASVRSVERVAAGYEVGLEFSGGLTWPGDGG
ncbi:MAG: PilZ domain-containing protein [Acidobacteriota bacterium]